MNIKAVSTRWLRVRIHHHQYHVCPLLNLFTLQTHFMHLERTPSICHDSRGSPVCGRLSNPLVEVKYHSCTLSVQSAIDSSVTLTQASMGTSVVERLFDALTVTKSSVCRISRNIRTVRRRWSRWFLLSTIRNRYEIDTDVHIGFNKQWSVNTPYHRSHGVWEQGRIAESSVWHSRENR